jgi:ribosomal protein S18 acetylase RimI-like enzyme
MPEIEIRTAISSDLPALIKLEHYVDTTHVWQMDAASDQDQIEVKFREIRLPRAVRLDYPRNASDLADTWTRKHLMLAAICQGQPIGYLAVEEEQTLTARVTDLVVSEKFRRQGIASALLVSARDWAKGRGLKRVVLEIQAKNHAAIQLARKLGFDFCGFSDDYFANHDIGVFFIAFTK